MKATNGNVFVTVEKLVDDVTPGGVFKDIRFNKHGKVTICGRVVAVPDLGNDEVLYEEFDGLPYHKTDRARFHRAFEYPCTGKEGDIAYFHYLTLEQTHNHIFTESGEIIYRVPLADVFCWIREGKIIMNFNWVLGTPFFGEGVEDVGGAMGKTKVIEGVSVPLVTEVVFKPQVDMAFINHIGPGIYSQREVNEDDLCFLTPSCEFENEIEGVKYWTFKHEDVIACVKGDDVLPVNDYCLIQTDRSALKSKIIVDERLLPSSNTGTFVLGGTETKEFERGDRVAFAKKDIRVMMVNLVIMKKGNIVCKLNEQAG